MRMALKRWPNASAISQPVGLPATSADRHLFHRWPTLRDTLPFIPLGQLPTAVDNAAELAKQLGVASLLIKRDDVSALDYGGNKVRKLEFLLADALAQEKHTVITFGGQGSNHAIATALNCKKLGLNCVAILTPEPLTDAVRATLQRHEQLGTRIELANRYSDARALADAVTKELGVEH